MDLLVKTEEDQQRQLKVTVEVPEERVQNEMRRTARKLSRELRIPGFRRGKVPYNVLVNRIGENALRLEAIESMLESVVEEALDRVDAEPYAQPTLDNLDPEPMILNITVPLEPTVALGDYRSIRKEIKEVEIADEAVEEALYQVRVKHQILEEVDRQVEEGDLVTMAGHGQIDDENGEDIWDEDGIDLPMDPERTFPRLPFVSNIIGLSAGEEKEFRSTFPDDYDDEELTGKTAVFQVKITKVQKRELPELSDELAKEEGGYETLADLELGLRKELFERARRDAQIAMLDNFIDELMGDAEIVYPPAAIEFELDRMLDTMKDQLERSGWQWDDYLKLQGETEADLRESWQENAIKRVERGFVMRQFVNDEQLSVDSAEIDEAVDLRLGHYQADDDMRQELRRLFTQGQGLELISSDILMEKIYERVEAILTGQAPDLNISEEETKSSADEEE